MFTTPLHEESWTLELCYSHKSFQLTKLLSFDVILEESCFVSWFNYKIIISLRFTYNVTSVCQQNYGMLCISLSVFIHDRTTISVLSPETTFFIKKKYLKRKSLPFYTDKEDCLNYFLTESCNFLHKNVLICVVQSSILLSFSFVLSC